MTDATQSLGALKAFIYDNHPNDDYPNVLLSTIEQTLEKIQWQPIETYNPEKHDNAVMVFDRIPLPARYDTDMKRWMFGGYMMDNPDYYILLKIKPTYWMPLPKAPQEEK